MEKALWISNKSQIIYEILGYLAENPEAQDTLDGIIQWWLLEWNIKYQMEIVKEVIAELVAKGFIREIKTGDGQVRYQSNQSKQEEIQLFLRERGNR